MVRCHWFGLRGWAGLCGGDKDLLGWGAFRVCRGSQAVYGASLENWCSSERMGSNPIPGAILFCLCVIAFIVGVCLGVFCGFFYCLAVFSCVFLLEFAVLTDGSFCEGLPYFFCEFLSVPPVAGDGDDVND